MLKFIFHFFQISSSLDEPIVERPILSDYDIAVLMSEYQWLNDHHINGAQQLLQKQFPHQNGLQNTLLLAEKLQYRSNAHNFVQIFNLNRTHWVCASNIGCPPEVVEVFDSIPSFSFKSYSLHQQLAAILQTNKSVFTIRFVAVQRQSGSSDCGGFSIVFAHAICCGLDPYLLKVEQKQLREHLISCFRNRLLTQLPGSCVPRRAARKRLYKEEEVKVYCLCRQPWKKGDNAKGSMVECCGCGEWFHQMCEHIPDDVFAQSSSKPWFCSTCSSI